MSASNDQAPIRESRIRLIDLRRSLGLSRRRFSRRLDCSRRDIERWERADAPERWKLDRDLKAGVGSTVLPASVRAAIDAYLDERNRLSPDAIGQEGLRSIDEKAPVPLNKRGRRACERRGRGSVRAVLEDVLAEAAAGHAPSSLDVIYRMRLGQTLTYELRDDQQERMKVAAAAGVDLATLASWEAGRTIPDPEQRKAIREVLPIEVLPKTSLDPLAVLSEGTTWERRNQYEGRWEAVGDEEAVVRAERSARLRILRSLLLMTSPEEAIERLGFDRDLYLMHEEGRGTVGEADAAIYAAGFRVSAEWLLHGGALETCAGMSREETYQRLFDDEGEASADIRRLMHAIRLLRTQERVHREAVAATRDALIANTDATEDRIDHLRSLLGSMALEDLLHAVSRGG